MLSINMDKCTGCGACVQRCPKQCISWKYGEFDFKYPKVDIKKCVNCGLCEKVCPIDSETIPPVNQKVYAAIHKDLDVLKKSTSGGAFTALADVVFHMNGVIYGVAMQDDMQVKHIRITSSDDLERLRGSKYLQSNTENTYQEVERDLNAGTTVLYSGTPCQIGGLKNFLQKEYDNLYTVDIICHGVGSQAYFDKYMEFAKSRYGKIKALKFRSKDFAGWTCGTGVIVAQLSNKEKKIPYRDFENYYYSYFLSGDIYRKCCYRCEYANPKRIGDFSLGDYWGVEALKISLATENGCSLMIINNEHASKFLKEIDSLDMEETTIEQAAHCNKQLNAPSIMPVDREKRIKEYKEMSGEEIQKEYLKTHRKTVIKGNLKAIIPYKLKRIIRKVRK